MFLVSETNPKAGHEMALFSAKFFSLKTCRAAAVFGE